MCVCKKSLTQGQPCKLGQCKCPCSLVSSGQERSAADAWERPWGQVKHRSRLWSVGSSKLLELEAIPLCSVALSGFLLRSLSGSFLKSFFFSTSLTSIVKNFQKLVRCCVKENRLLFLTFPFPPIPVLEETVSGCSPFISFRLLLFLCAALMSTLSSLFYRLKTDYAIWRLTKALRTFENPCQVFRGILAGFFRYRLVEFYCTVFGKYCHEPSLQELNWKMNLREQILCILEKEKIIWWCKWQSRTLKNWLWKRIYSW